MRARGIVPVSGRVLGIIGIDSRCVCACDCCVDD
jgi:hypothetical protein